MGTINTWVTQSYLHYAEFSVNDLIFSLAGTTDKLAESPDFAKVLNQINNPRGLALFAARKITILDTSEC